MPTRAFRSSGRVRTSPLYGGTLRAKARFSILRIRRMGPWAEFLRHEGITKESELANVRRALWAIEVSDDLPAERPRLADPVLTGGIRTYEECQREARRLRSTGTTALRAPSAALLPGGARGWKVDGGLQPAAERDGTVLAVFGAKPDLVGWMAALAARPRSDLLARVRHLSARLKDDRD